MSIWKRCACYTNQNIVTVIRSRDNVKFSICTLMKRHSKTEQTINCHCRLVGTPGNFSAYRATCKCSNVLWRKISLGPYIMVDNAVHRLSVRLPISAYFTVFIPVEFRPAHPLVGQPKMYYSLHVLITTPAWYQFYAIEHDRSIRWI